MFSSLATSTSSCFLSFSFHYFTASFCFWFMLFFIVFLHDVTKSTRCSSSLPSSSYAVCSPHRYAAPSSFSNRGTVTGSRKLWAFSSDFPSVSGISNAPFYIRCFNMFLTIGVVFLSSCKLVSFCCFYSCFKGRMCSLHASQRIKALGRVL